MVFFARGVRSAGYNDFQNSNLGCGADVNILHGLGMGDRDPRCGLTFALPGRFSPETELWILPVLRRYIEHLQDSVEKFNR